MADTTTPNIIPRHQWTHDGTRVLVLRCGAEGYGGFQWPTTVGAKLRVAAPTREDECDAGGFYGWPWGFGLGAGKDPDWQAPWIVFAADPADVIPIGSKVKCCGEVEIVFVGDWAAAMAYVLPGQVAWVTHAAKGVASATGEGGAAFATGWYGAASATGWYGAASATGWYGAASATGWNGAASATDVRGAASATGSGWSGTASATGVRGAASATGWTGVASTTGEYSAASATGEYGAAIAVGERGAASATGWGGAASAMGWGGAASATGLKGAASATGACSLAGVTGVHGRARGGPYSAIALAWWNDREQRYEMRCARIGIGDGTDGLLKAGVWYCLNDRGDFVECA